MSTLRVPVLLAALAFAPSASAQQSPEPLAPPAPSGYEPWSPWERRGLQLGLSASAVAVTVPLLLGVGRSVGEQIPSTEAAIAATALPMLAVVPLVSVGVGSLVAHRTAPGSGPIGWATLATTVAHLGLMALGIFVLGVDPVYDPSSVYLFTALEAVTLPLVSTLTMELVAPSPRSAP